MNANNKNKIWGVVPAAGKGSRFGSLKQYQKIGDKTILEWSLSSLLGCENIEKIVVCLTAGDEQFKSINDQIVIAVGGASRAESVLNGLNVLKNSAADDDWVLVHDAVRPFLLQSDLHKLVDELQGHSVGGLLALQVNDTLKRADHERNVIETVARENVWRAQTPQMFRFKILLQALQGADESITDESSAVERLGLKPKLVAGSASNIKVTYPEDLQQAFNGDFLEES